MRRIAIPILITAILGCQAGDGPGRVESRPVSIAVPAPKLDLSTPELAVQSYWAQKDWYNRVTGDAWDNAEKVVLSRLADPVKAYSAVAIGETVKYYSENLFGTGGGARKLRRDIESASRETGDRATVVARIRNVTPVPEGARPSPKDVERREAGVVFRYVLRKDGAAWKVAEIWRKDDSRGWEKREKRVPPKSTPTYPSDVWNDDANAAPPGETPPPKLDLSTPDRALRSFWMQRDWYQGKAGEAGAELDVIARATEPNPAEVYGAVMTGDALSYYLDESTFGGELTIVHREVESVRQESPSRALVFARIRNVSPIPEGVQPSPQEVERRRAGTLFRYVLQKEGASWKVAEIWRNDPVILDWERIARTFEPKPGYPSSVYSD